MLPTSQKKCRKRFLRGWHCPEQGSGYLPDLLTLLNFFEMFEIFLALFLAFACPAQNNNNGTNSNGTVITTLDDTGGGTGHIPPGPPPPPPL
jgi:hypothetical protein